MELKVEKLVTTEKMGGEIEKKAILKGEDGADTFTLTIVGDEIVETFSVGEPYDMHINAIQTKLGE